MAVVGAGVTVGVVVTLGVTVGGCFGAGCLLAVPEDCAEECGSAFGEAGCADAAEWLAVGPVAVCAAAECVGAVER